MIIAKITNLQLSALLTLELALELALEPTLEAGDRFEERRLDEGVVLALLPLLAHQAGSLFAKYSADSDDSLSLSLAELNIGSRFLEELLALTGGVSGIVDTSPELDRGLLAGLKSTLG